jgi:hypothetical protein
MVQAKWKLDPAGICMYASELETLWCIQDQRANRGSFVYLHNWGSHAALSLWRYYLACKPLHCWPCCGRQRSYFSFQRESRLVGCANECAITMCTCSATSKCALTMRHVIRRSIQSKVDTRHSKIPVLCSCIFRFAHPVSQFNFHISLTKPQAPWP